jgi:hypothetical protein
MGERDVQVPQPPPQGVPGVPGSPLHVGPNSGSSWQRSLTVQSSKSSQFPPGWKVPEHIPSEHMSLVVQLSKSSQVWARAPETAASATPMATKPSQRICIVIFPPICVSSSFDASVKTIVKAGGAPASAGIVGRGRRG